MFTRGFCIEGRAEEKYEKHREEFGMVSDAATYEVAADDFLGGGRRGTARECTRRVSRAIIRWDQQTNEFGVLCPCGVIRSYFILDTRKSRGRSFDKYFRDACASREPYDCHINGHYQC